MTVRVGLGFDAHRLVAGRKLVLGGVSIEYGRGLEGHSDGDAVLHAVADALLGAVAAPDLGVWFPSGDPAWRDAPSRIFVDKAVEVAAERGFHPQQTDVVIIAQEPKLAAHLPAMRARLAELLRISESAVGLKATTTDGMGFTGRGEGIAVQAVLTVAPGAS